MYILCVYTCIMQQCKYHAKIGSVLKINLEEQSLIFFGDDEKGEPIRDGTPIGQARNYRERIMELRKNTKL